ncbi:hypothetical protein [Leifsonia sp. NPDC058230]|uniref:hypothetical protein n=1 Tax=Leifsonia sp. NPDC058230 TaxID=3346391 RepID=UPI0036D7B228
MFTFSRAFSVAQVVLAVLAPMVVLVGVLFFAGNGRPSENLVMALIAFVAFVALVALARLVNLSVVAASRKSLPNSAESLARFGGYLNRKSYERLVPSFVSGALRYQASLPLTVLADDREVKIWTRSPSVAILSIPWVSIQSFSAIDRPFRRAVEIHGSHPLPITLVLQSERFFGAKPDVRTLVAQLESKISASSN